ncbi:aminotransferase class I/II-fold pyridoxal phosphate-dependent enzyme [Limosilactobacillus fastidiosus]|uniref:Aminotransferase n=1 Tax=Limosilactobacillus fastidiosus TaxID=2759855 RepID=A0A7W3TZQ3_9LACO|nr:aminotransferase class I/II-fold pyridoxal phosphate-dependent enzyme [Limosilactobacillus fastidiosus]MBB1063314.1 aminotransferase class I/II-fold pyridoxal phosphate-dependent enzyme [Limosilactobacillus fastidiosus]MBB1086288.1 aminotransferase class I/II-fold pyridoxal phosphate-dependent enzyme [Limosilactobacillus fastidiosus]MCD7084516.1 aminotransferase class I/II-fold pyridoxal phosphate-dependent enzyme [Limosilactobacillus fastidiosus]MCD7086392.1 aminotransferase class I/II-fold
MPKLDQQLVSVVNQRVDALPPAQIRAFDDEISAIPGIVKLTLGEPDFNVPDHVKQAAIRSIQDNESHYSPSRGTLPLRKAISEYINNTRSVDYDPETEVIVTVGATEAITATTFALLNPGDEVIIPTPIFSLYFPSVSLTGATPVKVDTSNDGFLLTADRLEKILKRGGDKVKAIILNYPNNPTGRSYSHDELIALATVIKKHHLLAVVDEIYSELIYDQPFTSLATLLPEQTVLISGLSKSHAMTGWRLGYVAAPQDVIDQISKMHSFMVTAPNDTAQAAALEALTNGLEDPDKFKQQYQKRRDQLASAMKKMGFEIAVPDGAFYIFAKIPEAFGKDDFKFARELANQAKVGVIPGRAFGPGGEGHIRLSYAASDEDIKTVIDRLNSFMEQFN